MTRCSALLSLFALVASPVPVEAQQAAPDHADYVEEAARKSGMPAALIEAVMGRESAGNARAVSPRGAMGLMQLMPATWQDLRREFGLGNDPFDPHDNILAGAYYLRTLYDRYGPEGFLAAYNAGPGRWKNHRDTGRPLPAETRAYVVAVTQKLGAVTSNVAPPSSQLGRPSWMAATLFLQAEDTGVEAPTVFVTGPSPFVPLPPTPPGLTDDTGQ